MNFKGLARLVRGFKIEVGEIRAQGPPAIIVAVSGLVLATGLVRLLNQNATVLPETLREAKALVDSLRSSSPKQLAT
jgi:hypothetical protein